MRYVCVVVVLVSLTTVVVVVVALNPFVFMTSSTSLFILFL